MTYVYLFGGLFFVGISLFERSRESALWVRSWLIAAGLAFLFEGALRLATQFENPLSVVSRCLAEFAPDFRPFLCGFAAGIVSVLLLSGHMNDPVKTPATTSPAGR